MKRFLSQQARRQLLFVTVLIVTTFVPINLTQPTAVSAVETSNGLFLEGHSTERSAVVRGPIRIDGIAAHPEFRKWQIDLLINGVEETFLALGEEPQPEMALLAEVDTRKYPDGDHLLRLRVVHAQLNYDEYFLPITFANSDAPAELATPTVTETPALEETSPPTPTSPIGGISVENGLLQGSVAVFGVATHPDFRKWQIDLLLNGDQTRATFIALGEEPHQAQDLLATLDSTRYPNGTHVLRLRVVHSNMNYDEYMTQVTFKNPLASTNGLPVSGLPVYRGVDSEAVIYLTFDDGPHLPYTQQILDLLAQFDAKATFFMVGHSAQGQTDLIKVIHEAGHGVANHSWSHRKLVGLSEDAFNEEVVGTANVLGAYAANCMRPPYGATDPSTYSHSTKLGYAVVLWSIDPTDWKRPGAQAIANHVINHAFPGAIVVLHDGGGDRSQTVVAVKAILKELSARGYGFRAYCR